MNEDNYQLIEKINELNNKGAILLEQKKTIEAKVYLDDAYKTILENNLTNIFLTAPILLNKISLDREFKNFDAAQKLLIKFILDLEDILFNKFSEEQKIFIIEKLLIAKTMSATIKSDLKNYNAAIKEFHECEHFYKLSMDMISSLNTVTNMYNNMAMTYSFIGNYVKAIEYYEVSLSIFEKNREDNNYKFNKADTLNNLGIMYQNIRNYKKAEKIFLEALDLHNQEYYKAMVYTNLGNMYRDIRKHNESLFFHRKSLEIRKKIAEENEAYLDSYAEELNNYGNILLDIKQFNEALSNLLNSISIIYKLSEKNPQKYKEKIAHTSINIGNCYWRKKEIDKARGYYKLALSFYFKNLNENRIEYLSQIIGVLCNIGCLEMNSGNKNLAEENFNEVFALTSEIKEMLMGENKKYLYVFKAKVEEAIKGLMELYSEDANKLLILIESKRNENFVPDLNLDLKNIFSEFNNEVLITIESTFNYIIFIVTDNTSNKVYKVKTDLFIELCNEMLKCVYLICYEKEGQSESEHYKKILNAGMKIFSKLPEEIQDILNSKAHIFLSLDRSFMNFPFEFLANKQKEFIGLKHLLPRVNGIIMLNEIINSSPVVDFQHKKILVDDPNGNLKLARREVAKIEKAIEHHDNTIRLTKKQANKKNILEKFNHNLALFHFAGHGSEPDRLLMAYGDHIDTDSICEYKFDNNPLIFLNSCLSGTFEYWGGGYFLGLPISFYKNGAKTIISSTYPIFDCHAKTFSEKFYDDFLNTFSVGDAVMNARQNKKYPWEWGLHIVYGNPKLKIKE